MPQAPHIPDRVLFERSCFLQVLVFGCAYHHRIADESCSDATLRCRRDEWIDLGVMEAPREMALAAYHRTIGLELSDLAVDGCITKAPCGGEKAGKSPVGIGESKASNAPSGGGREGHSSIGGGLTDPASRHDSPPLAPTLESVRPSRWEGCPRGRSSIRIAPTTRTSPASA